MKKLFNFSFLKDKSPNSNFKIQSFTFFIPAPPLRSTGYREKQFDKIFYEFINKGFEILSVNTENCSGTNQSGIWIICIVRATNEMANSLNLDSLYHDQLKDNSTVKQNIEGLYYIQDITNENE